MCAVFRAEIRCRAGAGTRAGTVQILTPEQKFDGVIAGRDVGFDLVDFVQGLDKVTVDGARIQFLAGDNRFRIGDHIGRVIGVSVRFRAVDVRLHVVDQAFVQRPGIHLAFPVVDDGIAEAVGLCLLIRLTSFNPGAAGRIKRGVRRLGNQCRDRALEFLGACQGVPIGGCRDVRIGFDDVFLRAHVVCLNGRGGKTACDCKGRNRHFR